MAPEAVNVTEPPGCMVADGGVMMTGWATVHIAYKTNERINKYLFSITIPLWCKNNYFFFAFSGLTIIESTYLQRTKRFFTTP
jgi:hypothetical protein